VKLKIYITVLLALAPSLAFAKPRNATAHMRPTLFRDRTPKARVPETHTRTVHGTTVKNAPVAQKEEAPF
jgi:hypothetical protein